MKKQILIFLTLILFSLSCKRDDEFKRYNGFKKDEAIVVDTNDTTEVISTTDSINNNVLQVSASFSQLNTKPSEIIITGAKEHKLLPIYKFKKVNSNTTAFRNELYSWSYDSNNENNFYLPA